MVTGLPLLYSCQTSSRFVRSRGRVQMVASMLVCGSALWGLQHGKASLWICGFVDYAGCMYAVQLGLSCWGGLARCAAGSMVCQ